MGIPGRDWPWEISSRADLVLFCVWAFSWSLSGSLVAMGVRCVVSMIAEGDIVIFGLGGWV